MIKVVLQVTNPKTSIMILFDLLFVIEIVYLQFSIITTTITNYYFINYSVKI